MANVNITTQAAKLSAVHYPVAFVFESEIIGTAAKASGGITITTATSGNYIKFDDDEVYIYCSDDPQFGQFFSTAAASLSDVAISLAYAINENPALNYKYLATPIPAFGVVSIQAVKDGSRFNQTITVPAGIATTNLTGGADAYRGQGLDNYEVWVELRLATGTYNGSTTTTDQVGIFSVKYNENNEYYFDFSDVLKNYVSYGSTPLTQGTVFQYINGSATPYSLVYGEGYSSGSTYVRKYFVDSIQGNWVVNTSLPINGQGAMTDYNATTNASFFTLQPNPKRTKINGHELLTIFWQKANVGLNFKAIIDVTFKGGTPPVSILRSTPSPDYDGLWFLDVGPKALNINNLNNSNNDLVDTYTVTYYAYNGFTNIQISTTQTYQMDYDCSDEEVELIWVNELGGYDSWTFSGKKATSSKSDKKIAQQYVKNAKNVYINRDVVLGNNEVEEFTVNSGWISAEEYAFVKHVDNSPAVYLWEGSSTLAEVIVLNSKIEYNSDTKLYSISTTYRYVVKKNHITN